MQNQMEKELIAVQIYSPPAEISSEYGDLVLFTKIKIHFVFGILMESDADIRCCRRHQGECFAAQARQSMIDQLRFNPGNFAKVK